MKKKLIYYILLFFCLFPGVENAFATIRLVTTTELNDTDEGSFQKIWKNVADQDTIMFDESLKNAVITGATLATSRVDSRYFAVIGNGVVLDLGLTIAGGGYRLENFIVNGSLASTYISLPVYIKNCNFIAGSKLSTGHLISFGTLANNAVKVIVEGSSFTSKGAEAATRWSTASGGSEETNRLTVHFISCTFESFTKGGSRYLIYATASNKGPKEITLTNCVVASHQPVTSVYGFNSATSYGYNVVKGSIDAGVSWTAQATDTVDVDMDNPLVLHGGVYKVVADGAAYQHLPANTAGAIPLPDGVSFPEKDILGNTIDYTEATHSGAVQAFAQQTSGITMDLADGDQLAAGATLAVTAELQPWGSEQTITWKSSATAIATITAAGVIQAIQEGTTTITATSEDMLHTASATLTVVGDFPLEGVELDRSALSLDLGYDRKLSASILPAVAGSKPLTWTSDDESVASVGTDGTVIARSLGAARIIVQINGTELKDTCEVTVKAADYTTGVFIVNEDWFGHNNSTLNYLYPESGDWNYRVIRHENADAGTQLGATTQHGAIYGGRFYLVSKQAADPGASTPGSRLAIADAATLKVEKEHKILAANENGTSIADGRSFLGVDEHKGYISTSNGIFILDLDTQEMTGKQITGSEGDPQGGDDPSLGGNPGLYTGQTGTMLRTSDYVFAIHQKDGVLIIDPATDQVRKVIGIPEIVNKKTPNDEGVYGSIIQSKDGYIWASVAVIRNGLTPSADFFVRIDPFTFDTTHVAITPDTGPGASWYAWTPDPYFAGINGNKLYWAATGAAMFSPLSEVYEYDIDTRQQKLLVNLNTYEDGGWHIYSSSIRIHPVTNEIYATLFRANGQPYYRTVRVSSETGAVLETYPMENNYWFSSIPVFPDNAAPVVDASSLTDLSLTENTYIYLGDKVSDADNLDAAIVKSVVNAEATVAGALIRHDTLFISPYKEGSTTLRLRFNSNGKVVEHEFGVTVEPGVVPSYPVTGISLNRSSVTLSVGEIFQLVANISPSNATNKAVEWVSSNTSIATVDANGLVSTHQSGLVVITATTVDGFFMANCTVTVGALPPSLSGSLTLDKTELQLAPLERAALTASASGSLAGLAVDWSSSNTSVADVTSAGVVIALAEGTSVITASIGSVSASCVVTVRPGNGTGIEAVGGRQASARHADGVLRLLNLEGFDCYVISLSGHLLRTIRPSSPDETHPLHLPAGVYIFAAQKNGERITFKFRE